MTRLLLFFILLTILPIGWSQTNYDSLLIVAQTSNSRADFSNIEKALQGARLDEMSSANEKKLVIVAASRTRELNFELLHGEFRFLESIINTHEGNFGTAMKMAKESLEIFSKYPVRESARCYNTMGSMLASQGDIETGLKYLDKAEEINSHFENDSAGYYMTCDNYLVKGYIYMLAEDYEKANENLDKSLEYANLTGYTNNIISVYLNKADLYRIQGEFSKALEYTDRSIKLSQKDNSSNMMCIGNYRKGQIFKDMGLQDSALFYYKIAEEIGLEQQMNRRLLRLYEAVTEIYTEKKNYKAATEYQARYIALSAIVETQARESRLEMMRIRFEVDEKIGEIATLALEKNHEKERNDLLTVAIIITATALVLLVVSILLFVNRSRLNRKIQIERQEKDLSKHQLTALRSQMNPHFIFNALNSIQDLILKENVEQSYTCITKFADLVRMTMNHANQEFIPIEDEFSSLTLYLELEALRFKNDIEIEFETNHIDHISIPPLLIQPVIENAIKHGLFHKKGLKRLQIHFSLKEVLVCRISDNGVGRKRSKEIQERRAKSHRSFAVESIHDRLKLLKRLYGNDLGVTYIDLENEDDSSGTVVILSVPFKHNF